MKLRQLLFLVIVTFVSFRSNKLREHPYFRLSHLMMDATGSFDEFPGKEPFRVYLPNPETVGIGCTVELHVTRYE